MRSEKAVIAIAYKDFERELAEYQRAQRQGGDRDLRHGFEVIVGTTSYRGGIVMAASDHNGALVSLLVELHDDNPEPPEQLFIVIGREWDTDEKSVWTTGREVFVGEPRALPDVTWTLKEE